LTGPESQAEKGGRQIRVFQENTMSNDLKPAKPPDPAELLATVKRIMAGWERSARRHFATHPPADQSTFEDHWSRVQTYFFHWETLRVTTALQVLSEGRQN
jgi:hypothetical protein